mmetsp:Transcript_21688/g.53169  ORF Transcript_21688/g.53169 Transcript_21688/m.53169 type:complete len:302 (-) Transcript_21688:150-1055(-)
MVQPLQQLQQQQWVGKAHPSLPVPKAGTQPPSGPPPKTPTSQPQQQQLSGTPTPKTAKAAPKQAQMPGFFTPYAAQTTATDMPKVPPTTQTQGGTVHMGGGASGQEPQQSAQQQSAQQQSAQKLTPHKLSAEELSARMLGEQQQKQQQSPVRTHMAVTEPVVTTNPFAPKQQQSPAATPTSQHINIDSRRYSLSSSFGDEITNMALGPTPKKLPPTAEELNIQRIKYGHNMTTELPPPPTAGSGTPSKRVPGGRLLPHLRDQNMYKNIGLQQQAYNAKFLPTPKEDRPPTTGLGGLLGRRK